MSDPYHKMVQYYDAENADLVEDLPAFLMLTERFGGPVLDVGCGTGRVTFFLASHGYDVTAIDLSESMLECARKRAEHHQDTADHITWLKADITQLDLDTRFKCAIFAYNGFMHLLQADQQLAALQHIEKHLQTGGAAVIDLPNPVPMFRADDVASLVVERTFTDLSGRSVIQSSLATVDRGSQIMDVTWVYDRVDDNGVMHRDMIPLQLRYTLATEMRLLMQIAGFSSVEICGDYDFGDYHEDSPRLLVIGIK